MDIRVATDILPDPAAYTPSGRLIRGGVWLTDGRIHVAWEAHRWSDAVTWPVDENRHPVLVVSSFHAERGALVENRVYDIFPPDVGAFYGYFGAAGGSRDGLFAVLHH